MSRPARPAHGLRIVAVALALAAVAPFTPVAHASALPRPAVVVPAGASQYVPLAPVRLAETRITEANYGGFTQISPNLIRVKVAGRPGVPANASAAVLNIVAINSIARGWVAVFPTGTPQPTVSNLNADAPGRTIANMATVKLGTNGSVDVYMLQPVNLAIDLSGVYVPVTDAVNGGRLVTVAAGAVRVLDTREPQIYGQIRLPANTTRLVSVAGAGVPSDASAVVVNVTAVNGARGFWTAYPTSQALPLTSTLNLDQTPQTRPAQAIVRLTGGLAAINVYSLAGGDLVVDVAGWFTGDANAPGLDGLFVPANPKRLLDTRSFLPLPAWNRSTFEFSTGRETLDVAAVALNITGLEPWTAGFVTLYPAGANRPLASNLNITAFGQVIANHAITRVSTRGIAIYTVNGAHLVADLAGWYLGTPSAAPNPKPPNLVLSPNKAVIVTVPSIGKSLWVVAGNDLDSIADQGFAAAFGGQVNVAQTGNIMLFAHRTKSSAGAPFYYLDRVLPGQTFRIIGADGHTYTYLVVRNEITRPVYTTIQSIATAVAPLTAQLIACDPLGSVLRRIVVTGRLISVD